MTPEQLLRQALENVVKACNDHEWSKADVARLAETALSDIPKS